VRGRDAPPVSGAHAPANEAKRKPRFSLRVSKTAREGVRRGSREADRLARDASAAPWRPDLARSWTQWTAPGSRAGAHYSPRAQRQDRGQGCRVSELSRAAVTDSGDRAAAPSSPRPTPERLGRSAPSAGTVVTRERHLVWPRSLRCEALARSRSAASAGHDARSRPTTRGQAPEHKGIPGTGAGPAGSPIGACGRWSDSWPRSCWLGSRGPKGRPSRRQSGPGDDIAKAQASGR